MAQVKKSALGTLARHGKYGALYGGATAAAGVGTARRSGNDLEGFAAVGGAAGGQATYQGAGKLAIHHNDQRARLQRKTLAAGGFSGKKQDKTADAHFARYGLDRQKHKHDASEAYREMFRNYPKELPGSKVKRLLAHTHGGRTGDLIGGAVTTAGAVVLARAARSPQHVGKASEYGRRDRNLSATRVTEAGLGGFLFAHGASHARAVGPMTAYGARLAEKDGHQEVRAAIEAATAMANATRLATDRGATQLRRLKRVSNLVDKVPANLRPATAITVGALLVQHARPLHNERFTPESRF